MNREIDEAIELFQRLYRYGEEGLTIDANIACEIEKMIESLEAAKAEPEPNKDASMDEILARMDSELEDKDEEIENLKLIVRGLQICVNLPKKETEFTRNFRHLLQTGNGAGSSTYEAVYESAEESCSIINRLTADRDSWFKTAQKKHAQLKAKDKRIEELELFLKCEIDNLEAWVVLMEEPEKGNNEGLIRRMEQTLKGKL